MGRNTPCGGKIRMTQKKHLKFLFISSDKFPPFRVDVAILFGKEIVARGHKIDWILQSEQPCRSTYKTKWRNGTVWVGKTETGAKRINRVKKHLYRILHSLRVFQLTRRNNYDFVFVSWTQTFREQELAGFT